MSIVIRVVSLLLHRLSVYIEASCVPKDWIESFFKEVLQEKWAGKTWANRKEKKNRQGDWKFKYNLRIKIPHDPMWEPQRTVPQNLLS